jgi:hypothetical protein
MDHLADQTAHMALVEPRKSLLDLPGGEAAKTTNIHLSPLTAQRFATKSTTTISLADPNRAPSS